MTSAWVVAGANIFLALGTVFLGLQARNEARAVRTESTEVGEQVKLEREQLEASTRPYVVPAPDSSWLTVGLDDVRWRERIPAKNAGPGVALNVRGELNFGPPTGVHVKFMQTTFAPGDERDLLIEWSGQPQPGQDWIGVVGKLDYEDIRGHTWQTYFRIYEEDGRRRLRVFSVDHQGTQPEPSAGLDSV